MKVEVTLDNGQCVVFHEKDAKLACDALLSDSTSPLLMINCDTYTVLFQMTGNFSIEKASDGDLEVTGEDENGRYYKHFVCLSRDITYIIEDLGKTGVSKHRYEINFNPAMIWPIEPVVVN